MVDDMLLENRNFGKQLFFLRREKNQSFIYFPSKNKTKVISPHKDKL